MKSVGYMWTYLSLILTAITCLALNNDLPQINRYLGQQNNTAMLKCETVEPKNQNISIT